MTRRWLEHFGIEKKRLTPGSYDQNAFLVFGLSFFHGWNIELKTYDFQGNVILVIKFQGF